MRDLPPNIPIAPGANRAAWRRLIVPILTRARTGISTGVWHGKSIYDGAIHPGDAAFGLSRHCDARGDGRPDGADRRRRAETGAPGGSHRGDGAARCGRADHGDRVDQEPAGHVLRRRGLDLSRAGVDRHHGTRDAGRRVRHRREEQGTPLEHVRRCRDAEHAAHHLERHRAARRAAARLCGLARLRADALRICGKAVRQDADRDAGDHLAERCGAGRYVPPGAVHAEGGGHRGRAGACRDAHPRGRGGRQGGRRGEESRRDSGARGNSAHGVAAQAGRAEDPRRRRAGLRRQGARRRKDGPGQGAGRGAQAEGRRQGRGSGDAARYRQG